MKRFSLEAHRISLYNTRIDDVQLKTYSNKDIVSLNENTFNNIDFENGLLKIDKCNIIKQCNISGPIILSIHDSNIDSMIDSISTDTSISAWNTEIKYLTLSQKAKVYLCSVVLDTLNIYGEKEIFALMNAKLTRILILNRKKIAKY